MTRSDLDAVIARAKQIHPDYPEDDAIFAERLELFPEGCRVLREGPEITAYLISHPWHADEPPPLNHLLTGLPASPTTYYIHDLALLPRARSTGAAANAVGDALAIARKLALPMLSLIAVNHSAGFWIKHGFVDSTTDRQRLKLASYGKDACFMTRPVA